MADVAKLGFRLAALGLRRVSQVDEVQEILKFGLSFLVSDDIADGVVSLLDRNQVVLDKIAEVGHKVDLLLGEATNSSLQILRDAFIAYDSKNFKEAALLFREVRQNAIKAFNLSDNVEAWVMTTQLKVR